MRNGSSLAALLAALTAAALAQQTANVSGTVTNSVTGAPVVRAHVTLRGEKTFGALTNGEGKFSITGIAPGGYAYAVERVGFGRQLRIGTPSVDLHSGDNSLDLKLTPVGSIAGRVLDAEGEPVQLVGVSAEGNDDEYSAVTDSKGRYRIGGLAPGRYRVKAWFEPQISAPEIRTDGSKQVHYKKTYYPGVPASKGATRVGVAAGGETSGIDIPLLTTPIVKISGKVLDIPAMAKDVTIHIGFRRGPNSSEGFSTRAGKDGSFVIWALEPNKYTLWAEMGSGGGNDLQSAPVELALGTTDIDHVALRLVPTFDISGHVEYEDEGAREAAKSVEGGLPPGMQRQVFLADSDGGRAAQAEIGDDDSFKLEKVQPGQYTAEVYLGSVYVKSLRLGAVEGDTLDVRNVSGGAALTLLVSAARGEISGTVSDFNGPVSGATVMVMRDRVSTGVTADSSGHYLAPNLRPGTYKLVAGDERIEGLGTDSAEIEDYEDTIVTVEVHAGEKITLDLKQVLPDK